jgi:ABC-2 type transport system ATP-binding protein
VTTSEAVPVRAEALVKRYGNFRAVDGVSLSVPQGSIYGVLGPNGAGKTTTLRMLLGIIDPDSGTRSLLGSARPRDMSHRVGYLPEERGLYPGMKAKEAIAFMGALRGLSWAEGRKRGAEMLEEAGLSRAIDAKIRKLSKGMAQLVQLLGSIVHRPELIVLDEPFSGLDPVNQNHLEKLILAERARGATILFSTHVMGHAERMCDALSIIAGGQVRFEGSVDDARSSLPMRANYEPCSGGDAVARLLPPDAEHVGDRWRFTVPADGPEELVMSLVQAGHGIAGLTIERPSLHEAFVKLVGETDDLRGETHRCSCSGLGWSAGPGRRVLRLRQSKKCGLSRSSAQKMRQSCAEPMPVSGDCIAWKIRRRGSRLWRPMAKAQHKPMPLLQRANRKSARFCRARSKPLVSASCRPVIAMRAIWPHLPKGHWHLVLKCVPILRLFRPRCQVPQRGKRLGSARCSGFSS